MYWLDNNIFFGVPSVECMCNKLQHFEGNLKLPNSSNLCNKIVLFFSLLYDKFLESREKRLSKTRKSV